MSLRMLGSPVAEPVEGELAVAADRGQQVVEVVGDAAGELADGLHLLRLAQLALEAQRALLGLPARRDVLEHGDRELRPRESVANERDRVMAPDDLAALRQAALFQPVLLALALGELAEELELAGAIVGMRELGSRLALELLLREAEHLLESAVARDDAAFEIEHAGADRGRLEHRAKAFLAVPEQREDRERAVRDDERRDHCGYQPGIRAPEARQRNAEGRDDEVHRHRLRGEEPALAVARPAGEAKHGRQQRVVDEDPDDRGSRACEREAQLRIPDCRARDADARRPRRQVPQAP